MRPRAGDPKTRTLPTTPEGTALPRLLDRHGVAWYLSVSPTMVDRLVQAGELRPVRIPVQRHASTSVGMGGQCRRMLFDRLDVDALIAAWKRDA